MEYCYYYKQGEGAGEAGEVEEEQMLLSRKVLTCGEEQIIKRISGGVGVGDSSSSGSSYASSLCSYLAAKERKLVCVTSGNSYLGMHLIKELLSYGYLVRATVENQGDLEDMNRLMMSDDNEMRRLESVVVAKMASIEALSDAFRGCHVVFHTSSFIDPRGLSGYNERTAFLETEGAKNVIEACGRAAYIKRCVFTSSLLSCIWNEQNANEGVIVDDRTWSDEDFCRDNKLWLALGKTRAEKAAWTKSRQLKVRLVTICPGLVMEPTFPNANYETSLPYLKSGRLMLSRGLLATEDAGRLARAEVQLYEAMDNGGASGRYVIFERVIDRLELARRVENGLKMQGLLTSGFDWRGDYDDDEVVVRGKVSCERIKRLLAQESVRPDCRKWEVRRN